MHLTLKNYSNTYYAIMLSLTYLNKRNSVIFFEKISIIFYLTSNFRTAIITQPV